MKTPPSTAWTPRSEPFPPIGELVDVCWETKPGVYEYGELRLKRHFLKDGHKMSEWLNKDNLLMIFNPDFWKHKSIHIPETFIDLKPFEQYLGARLVDGKLHHLIMVAVDDRTLPQEAQRTWAEALGGRLPTLDEAHLLMPFVRKFHISVWLSEPSRFFNQAGVGMAHRDDGNRAISVRSIVG